MTARAVAFALSIVVLLLVPYVTGSYQVKLLQEILIWGAFAMSLDLMMGFAGMVSFGHSAFFGLGGYVAALALRQWPGVLSGLLLPAAAAALVALVLGFLCIRVSGVYFIMLTLAFSQMFFAVTFQVQRLGAEDGIVGVPRPHLFGVDLAGGGAFHVYLVVLLALLAALVWRIVLSPFGHVLRGIHENEARMEAVGYPVRRYKLLAFVIAGTVAGIAGALYTQLNGYI